MERVKVKSIKQDENVKTKQMQKRNSKFKEVKNRCQE